MTWHDVQVALLEPQDRVLLLSNARDPVICVKKDADAIKELYKARVLTPLPSQASCSVSMCISCMLCWLQGHLTCMGLSMTSLCLVELVPPSVQLQGT